MQMMTDSQKVVCVRMSREDAEELARIAVREQRTVSSQIRHIVDRFLKAEHEASRLNLKEE